MVFKKITEKLFLNSSPLRRSHYMVVVRSLAADPPPPPPPSPAMQRHPTPPKRPVHGLVLPAFARLLPIAPQTTDVDSFALLAGASRRHTHLCASSPAPSRLKVESKFGDRVVAAWESPARAAGEEEAAGRPGYLRRRRRGRESEEVRKFQVPFFSISLNDCEIEEDFLAMTGWRQPRRPKKRSKFVEKKLEVCFFFFNLLFAICG